MTIIEIEALENGAHRNLSGDFLEVRDGWIEVPEELEAEARAMLPFIELEIEDGVLVGVAAGEAPEQPEAEESPDIWDELAAAIREGANRIE